MPTGTVKWFKSFKPTKGYGFIVPDDGSEALEFDAGFSSPFGSDAEALFSDWMAVSKDFGNSWAILLGGGILDDEDAAKMKIMSNAREARERDAGAERHANQR